MPASATSALPLHQHHQSHHDRSPKRDPRRNRYNWHIRTPTFGPRRLQAKNHIIAAIGEYIGTLLFLMLAFGAATVANIPSTSITDSTTTGQGGSVVASPNVAGLLYTSFGFGFSLMVCVFVFFRVSGGLFNPAVSLGMLLVGAISPLRAVILVVSQLLGGISGAALIEALLPGTINVRTTKGGGISTARAFWLETFCTGVLMLSILLLATAPNRARHMAPLVIGFALFSCELVSIFYTGGSLNPARSFGPAVVVRQFTSYHWIYWVAPCLGSTIAALLYRFLRALEFETVMGPEEPECNLLHVAPSTTESSSDAEAQNGGGPNEKGWAIEGTGFGDLLHSGDHPDDDASSAYPHHLSLPNYEERFNRLEAMMAQVIEAGQSRGGAGRVSGESWAPHSGGGARKGSVAGTLVEEGAMNEKGTMQHV